VSFEKSLYVLIYLRIQRENKKYLADSFEKKSVSTLNTFNI